MENEQIVAFDEDKEFGNLVSFFIKKLAGNKMKPHHPIYRIVKWANECGVGRNDPCPCGSGKKFKKCCIE